MSARPRQQQKREQPVTAAAPTRFARLAWLTAGTIAALFILTFTVPWQAAFDAPTGAFDYSWMVLLHDAVATGRQFGKQIILPQGPLGFIGTDIYDPRTYWVLIAARSAIALIAFWSIWEIAKKLLASALVALPWMLAVILLIGKSPDHFFPGCAVLLLMNYFVVHERKLSRSAIALIVALAASSLIKVNQPFYAIAVVGALTIDQILQRQRTFFIAAATYVGAFLLLYLAARQAPSNLGTFLWGWWQVALGHADAVGLSGPIIDPIIYLAIVALILGLVATFEWKRRRLMGIVPVAGLAAVLLLLYKHSFMRQDYAHVDMGPMVATATAILFAPVLWPMGGTYLRAASLAVIAVSSVVLTSILSSYTRTSDGKPGPGLLDYAIRAPAHCLDNISAAVSDVTDPMRLHRKWEANRQRIRGENPLPLDKIAGTVDVYPHRQDIVFAYGLRYEPRPVVSSLVATSTTLADVNARHLRGPSAAQTILFDIDPVDHNFPTMLDGESLPELLTRYDVVDRSGALLVLRRAIAPRAWHLAPLLTKTGRFMEEISIPPFDDAPIWAQIRFKKRFGGRVKAALYKPAWVGIITNANPDVGYRLLPSLAEQGFLLSPLIKDRLSYAQLASRNWAEKLKPAMVTSIIIAVEDGSQDLSFDPDFEIVLSRLEFKRQD